MLALALGFAFLAANPSDHPPQPGNFATFEEAREALGRGPEGHLSLAIWCEARGLDVARSEQLGLAVLADPENATIRGLMGQVRYRGRWRHPEDVAGLVRDDPLFSRKLDDYEKARQGLPDTADRHWDLALWCDWRGLPDQAEGHFAATTRLDPRRGEAWERLGYRRLGDRWLLPRQIEAELAEREAQAVADKEWRPRFDRWKAALAEKDRRDGAEREITEVSDPRAVPMIEKTLVEGGSLFQLAAIAPLSKIRTPEASKALAKLAVSGHSDQVRRRALDALSGRDRRDFVGHLIDQLRDPIRMTILPVTGPGSTGELMVESPRFKEDRIYQAPALPQVRTGPIAGEYLDYDALGLPCIVHVDRKTTKTPFGDKLQINGVFTRMTVFPVGQVLARAEREALEVKLHQRHDIQHVKRLNATLHADNARVVAVLRAVTGQDLGDGSAEPWRSWWSEQRGYRSNHPTPDSRAATVTEITPRRRRPIVPYAYNDVSYHVGPRCCFAAGTPVWTLTGRRPIESIRVGDGVLTEDVESGRLEYRPVMGVEHNPPDRLMKVALVDAPPVLCTDLHRFWKAGEGWAMVRDLKPGDRLRTLGGTARVASIEESASQPTFNLETFGGQDYFAGPAGLLAHDNSPEQPIARRFDAARDRARP